MTPILKGFRAFFCLTTLAGLHTAFSQDRHPGFDLYNLRPNGFDVPGTGDMVFLPNGDLALAAWGGNDRAEGELWIVSGLVGATGGSGVTTRQVASNLREPLGIQVINGELIILEKHRLTRAVDETGTGEYGGNVSLETFYDGWDEDNVDWHDFSFGMVYKEEEDAIYFNTGLYPPNTGGPGLERGSMLKVDVSNPNNISHSIFVGGMRNAPGAGLGPERGIFSVDNQGAWVPNNKMVHQVQGRFYGMKKGDDNVMDAAFEAEGESPPVVWFQYPEAGESNTEPMWLTSGRFAGQMLVGDIRSGGIKRVFLERIDGEYQGCVFPFMEPNALEAGVGHLEYGPDGSIYIGGLGGGGNTNLGGSGNWNWNDTYFSLERMEENDTPVFEMLAVRSVPQGFEIEFTEPHGNGADNPGNYTIRRWGVNPIYAYGGGSRENLMNDIDDGVEVVDERRVLVKVSTGNLRFTAGILPSIIFHISLNGGIQSASGQSIRGTNAWYTLNWLGPADVLGCTDQAYQEYNADADYDDGLQCVNEIVAARPVNFEKTNIQLIPLSNQLAIQNFTGNNITIQLINPLGEIAFETRKNVTPETRVPLTGLTSGVYVVRLHAKDGFVTRKVIIP